MVKSKKVFVSGCFDCFHAGHAEFLRKASEFGDVYVSLGSDKNIRYLKEIKPTFNEKERAFIIQNIKGVKKAFVSKGMGKLDFVEDIKKIKPDVFVVNEEGDSLEKREICKKFKIKYIVLKRKPHKELPKQSSTNIREKKSQIPFRIDLAGGWLDQPYISKYFPGPVLTISLEPSQKFDFRSGMASSTRNKAIKLWGNHLPKDNPEQTAKILFSFENPPGTREKEIAGAQDAIGIVFPGLAYSYFEGKYWPKEIKHILDEKTLKWIEKRIHLVKLKPREVGYSVFKNSNITKNKHSIKNLSKAAEKTFQGIKEKNFKKFSEGFLESFNAQTTMFPSTFPEWIKPTINKYQKLGAKAWKLSGAGGGGYLILLSEKPIKGTKKIKIRRR